MGQKGRGSRLEVVSQRQLISAHGRRGPCGPGVEAVGSRLRVPSTQGRGPAGSEPSSSAEQSGGGGGAACGSVVRLGAAVSAAGAVRVAAARHSSPGLQPSG